MAHLPAARIVWSVMWIVTDGEGDFRIVEKQCDTDLDEAMRIHEIAKRAGKKMLTMRSCNAGFPPPEKYQEYKLENYGTVKEPKWVKVLFRMERVNAKGIYWCPYCRQFRRFNRQTGMFVEGTNRDGNAHDFFVPDDTKGGGLFCPMCGISYRDLHVRNWNPTCARMYDGRRTTRRRTRRGVSANAGRRGRVR